MAAPPPPFRPGGAPEEESSDYYYSDEGPEPPARGPPGIPMRTPGMGGPPPIPNRPGSPQRAMPPMPGARRSKAKSRMSKNSKARSANGAESDYDYYYYDEDQEGYDYEYEYDYEDAYEYEYMYEDEDDASLNGMARPKLGAGGPMGFSSNDLLGALGNLKKGPAPTERAAPAPQSRPFGLDSTRINQIRANMTAVSKKYEKQPVMQQDFRGNLVRVRNTGPAVTSKSPVTTAPGWMNKNLRPQTERPMTTKMNGPSSDVNPGEIKQNAATRNVVPKFMNGLPVGRVSVRKRVRASTNMKNQPPNGRVSAKLAMSVKADPNNPNKFLAKNRVSYKVRKPGGEKKRVSKRVSRNSVNNNRVSRRSKRTSANGGVPNINRVSRRSRRSANGAAQGPSVQRVSRRKRGPSVGRTSVNQGIFTAKKKSPDAPGIGKGDGCYLQFDSSNGGVLYAQWTTDGIEDSKALAYFKPDTPVPRLNYKKNRGRVDLMTGTQGDQMKFCEAWTYFFALGREYDGFMSVLSQGREPNFSVDFVCLTPRGEVKHDNGDRISTKDIDCIAVLPTGSRAFEGVERVTSTFFINNANREGHALKLAV